MWHMPERRRSAWSHPVVVVSVLSMMLRLAAAAQYTVGDTKGWTANVNYTDWVAQHTFHEGDTIVFSYARGDHDVLRVSLADYDSCRVSDPIETDSSGQSTFELRTGDYYFICGFPAHCNHLQKLSLKVEPSGSSLPIPRADPIGNVPNVYNQSAEAPGPSGFFSLGAAPVTSMPSLHSVVLPILGCLLGGCHSMF